MIDKIVATFSSSYNIYSKQLNLFHEKNSLISRSLPWWRNHAWEAGKAGEDIINIRPWPWAEQAYHPLTVVQPGKVVSLKCLPVVP